jgi:hypothetical protein
LFVGSSNFGDDFFNESFDDDFFNFFWLFTDFTDDDDFADSAFY